MLNLNSLMIGSMQPDVLAAFYEKLIGRPADMQDGNWYGWQVGNCWLNIGEHSEAQGKSKEPARIIINLETTEVENEFKRVTALGVDVIKEPYNIGGDMMIATLADPDGNYIQLMSPWKQEA